MEEPNVKLLEKIMSEQQKLREFKRSIKLFHFDYTIIFYYDTDQLSKRFPDLRFDVDVRDFQAGVFDDCDGKKVMAFHDDGKLTAGMIAHECLHLVNGLFAQIGYNPLSTNDEIQAYLLAHVVDKVHSCWKRTSN